MNTYKILVVDDEARMRKLIKDFLIAKEYTVIEASNGQEALDIFEADKSINLIILDVMMPILDGWATLREIRATSKIPVIMHVVKKEMNYLVSSLELMNIFLNLLVQRF